MLFVDHSPFRIAFAGTYHLTSLLEGNTHGELHTTVFVYVYEFVLNECDHDCGCVLSCVFFGLSAFCVLSCVFCGLSTLCGSSAWSYGSICGCVYERASYVSPVFSPISSAVSDACGTRPALGIDSTLWKEVRNYVAVKHRRHADPYHF